MDWSRRDVCVAVPALLAMARMQASAQGTTGLLPSKVYSFDDLPVRKSGALTYRGVLSGKLYEGGEISLHESELAPHSIPHQPHKHRHEEMVFVLDGTLEFTINGKTSRVTKGGVAFIGSGDEHGIRNPGPALAKYYVVEIGQQR